GHDRAHAAPDQIGRKLREPIVVAVAPAEFDSNVLSFDMAGVLEPEAKRIHQRHIRIARAAAEGAEHRPHTLLRDGRDPACRGGAEQAKKWGASHSMTSSAVASSVGGRVRRIARAVARLMMSSNLVGRATGMSAGFSPLRMRPT